METALLPIFLGSSGVRRSYFKHLIHNQKIIGSSPITPSKYLLLNHEGDSIAAADYT